MLVSNPYEGERRPGTVGFSLPGVRLKLEEGSGEILVNGPNVFEGYWNRPDADSESFSSDSVSRWFRTGDLGELDEGGYLKIVGRKKELIISGGYNVYPREVDDVLITHPDIEEVAVAGVPSKEWGEEVVAWIVPSPNQEAPSLEEIRDFGRQYLAAYKLPKRVVVTDVLPRNALGKVLRQELREK
jgi:malonyl-CoA/methylmalonyl-CoA synthetase